MVRKATTRDIKSCLKFARLFHEGSSWKSLPFCEQSARQTLDGLISSKDAVIFISDKGFIGAVLAPVLFNFSHKIAYEMFWFSERGGGAELLKAYEEWADDNNAYPLMVCLEDENTNTMTRLYRRKGYVPTERYFIKGVA